MAIIIVIAALFALFSCAPAKKADALDVLRLPAKLLVEGERNGVAFCAEMSLGEVRADGSRCGEIVYSLPEAFQGLRIKTDSGVWEAELGEVRISGRAAEALGAPLTPFMQIRAAESAELTADAQTLITVSTGNVMLEFTVDGESGLPISICEKTSSGEMVMEFKIAEYKIQNPSE